MRKSNTDYTSGRNRPPPNLEEWQFILWHDNIISSQPNGRSDDSSGPTPIFFFKFSSIQTPKKDLPQYEKKLARSVVGEFNRSQVELGRGTCSNGSAHKWLKKHRPKVAVCPHKQNYCDTCSQRKEQIREKQTTINRLLSASASDPETISHLQDKKRSLKQSLECHCKEAEESHDCITNDRTPPIFGQHPSNVRTRWSRCTRQVAATAGADSVARSPG